MGTTAAGAAAKVLVDVQATNPPPSSSEKASTFKTLSMRILSSFKTSGKWPVTGKSLVHKVIFACALWHNPLTVH